MDGINPCYNIEKLGLNGFFKILVGPQSRIRQKTEIKRPGLQVNLISAGDFIHSKIYH